jgi:hypothetical protein
VRHAAAKQSALRLPYRTVIRLSVFSLWLTALQKPKIMHDLVGVQVVARSLDLSFKAAMNALVAKTTVAKPARATAC